MFTYWILILTCELLYLFITRICERMFFVHFPIGLYLAEMGNIGG